MPNGSGDKQFKKGGRSTALPEKIGNSEFNIEGCLGL